VRIVGHCELVLVVASGLSENCLVEECRSNTNGVLRCSVDESGDLILVIDGVHAVDNVGEVVVVLGILVSNFEQLGIKVKQFIVVRASYLVLRQQVDLVFDFQFIKQFSSGRILVFKRCEKICIVEHVLCLGEQVD